MKFFRKYWFVALFWIALMAAIWLPIKTTSEGITIARAFVTILVTVMVVVAAGNIGAGNTASHGDA